MAADVAGDPRAAGGAVIAALKLIAYDAAWMVLPARGRAWLERRFPGF